MRIFPGTAESCWIADAPSTAYPALPGDVVVDVAVIGGGIVGLTAALLLKRAGKRVAVLEMRRVGRQVTGRSTAKITSLHALIYRHLTDCFGAETARLYGEANQAGLALIRDLARELRIDCNLETKNAYTYATGKDGLDALRDEAELARRLGLPADFTAEVPLPFPTAGAVRFSDQAQFNPATYLVALAAAIEGDGCSVFEDTLVTKAEEGEPCTVETSRGTVLARDVIVASHTPIAGHGHFHSKTRPRGHMAIAARIAAADLPDGMFLSAEQPTHSIRGGRDADGPLLVVLGPRFPQGQHPNTLAGLRELEAWTRERFPIGEIAYRWTNEDYETPDRVPLVGRANPDSRHLYVGVAFNAWGISNGTAASLILADLILNRPNAWARVFDATRDLPRDFNPGGDTATRIASLADLAPGDGGVLDIDGTAVAAWKDDQGQVHTFSAACTHKGCSVTWNHADRTWDCPCHGSVFTAGGAVVHGPARKPLEPWKQE
ncbi:FAD-dependent oxidoreductase [Azospirillum sp. SYSU D00513]|uniref:FAD-dependent oxidoreductase n=1 Tax=Azospirillum sp. SYSU D00513 TaxID=2812561 RepID=UPI001A967B90|nr:FAD-dependent oxidoreductase [Azospirillum sp. SYSU D00513]